MLTPEREWYTYEQAAEALECEVNYIVHCVQAGKVEPVFWFENESAMMDFGKEGEKYPIGLNGLFACLSSLRYFLKGTQSIVYSIEPDTKEKVFLETFTIKNSFEEAKVTGYPVILFHPGLDGEADKWLVALSVIRIDGATTAKRVILKADLHRLKSELRYSNGVDEIPPKEGNQGDVKRDKRIENTNLTIIGALVSILLEGNTFNSQADIIEAIEKSYPKTLNLKPRCLQGRFAEANKALKESTKD